MTSTLTAGRYDLHLRQGKTFRRRLTWRIDAAPVDISDMEFRAAIRATPEATEARLELTEGAGITNGGPTGVVELVITDTETDADLAGVWDLSVTYANGDDVSLIDGDVFWTGTATR